jgi:hypothetical protein
MAAVCATVIYNGLTLDGTNGFPSPTVTAETSFERFNNDGPITTIINNYSLDGKISAVGYTALIAKAITLKNAFSKDGSLSIEGLMDGPVKLNSFQLKPSENYWTQTIDYSASLTYKTTGNCPSSSGETIESYNNTWQIQPIEEYNYFDGEFGFSGGTNYPAMRVTHTVSAVGKYVATGTGVVTPCSGPESITGYAQIKFDRAVACVKANFNSNKLIEDSGSYYDFLRTVDANTAEGSYSITDSYLYFVSGTGSPPSPAKNYIDSCTVEGSVDETALRTVVVQGTVKGLNILKGIPKFDNPYALGSGTKISGGFLDTANYKFKNAKLGFDSIKDGLYGRATSVNSGYIPSGCSFFYGRNAGQNSTPTVYLNPRPLNTSIGYNPIQGEVTYSFTYNNRPANLLDCSITESLTVNDIYPTQQIAEVFVIGRKLGPVLQNLGTFSSPTRQVTLDVVLPRASSISGIIFPTNVYKQITGIIELFNPKYAANMAGSKDAQTIKSFVRDDNESWDPTGGRFTKSKTWIYTKCQGTLEDLTNPNVG